MRNVQFTLNLLSWHIEREIRLHFEQFLELPEKVLVGQGLVRSGFRPRSFKLKTGQEVRIRIVEGRNIDAV